MHHWFGQYSVISWFWTNSRENCKALTRTWESLSQSQPWTARLLLLVVVSADVSWVVDREKHAVSSLLRHIVNHELMHRLLCLRIPTIKYDMTKKKTYNHCHRQNTTAVLYYSIIVCLLRYRNLHCNWLSVQSATTQDCNFLSSCLKRSKGITDKQ